MTVFKKLLVGAAIAASITASSAFAQNITGSLTFGAPTGTNYFDPGNGYVPAGYGNVAGTTVAIGSGVEFGFQDGSNLDIAEFSATAPQLTITDVTSAGAGASPFFMAFTSNVAGYFNGAAFAANGFGGTISVTGNGNILTFAAPGWDLGGATRVSVITFTGATAGVPEPATWALMMLGFGGIGFAMRRKSKAAYRIRYA